MVEHLLIMELHGGALAFEELEFGDDDEHDEH